MLRRCDRVFLDGWLESRPVLLTHSRQQTSVNLVLSCKNGETHKIRNTDTLIIKPPPFNQ